MRTHFAVALISTISKLHTFLRAVLHCFLEPRALSPRLLLARCRMLLESEIKAIFIPLRVFQQVATSIKS